MPQMLRLSQDHWLNLETIVDVQNTPDGMMVTTTALSSDGMGDHYALRLILHGEERDRLLTWLETHSVYMTMSVAGAGAQSRENESDEPLF